MVQQHTHVYLLPTPNGRESIGVCKECGEQKTHFNSGNDRAEQTWKVWEGKEKDRK